jgi:hypothetical protein
MLPDIFEKESTLYKEGKEWNEYLIKIGDFSKTVDKEFLSQICFEHFERFNIYFPLFNFEHYKVIRIKKTTREIYETIRYDKNEEINFWCFQVDDYLDRRELENYDNLRYTVENKTWSFAPVIIEHSLANKIGNYDYGKPFHLIEGTHRISFINRLYELELINGDAEHELLCIVEI